MAASDLYTHSSCGRTFDIGHVTVTARYADCSVFKCPGCGAHIDDRPGVHLRPADARERGTIRREFR